jgi:MFS superfamily sulfate permease-like transporter
MRTRRTDVIYVITLVVVVVGVDVLFFRHHFLPRLIANVVIVVVFAASYWAFQRTTTRGER